MVDGVGGFFSVLLLLFTRLFGFGLNPVEVVGGVGVE
tara:strand:- start:127 stop:237 length:111 start_codon:yes stop_codon:yes gene_type:complete